MPLRLAPVTDGRLPSVLLQKMLMKQQDRLEEREQDIEEQLYKLESDKRLVEVAGAFPSLVAASFDQGRASHGSRARASPPAPGAARASPAILEAATAPRCRA